MAPNYDRLSNESARSVPISDNEMDKMAFTPTRRWTTKVQWLSFFWRAVRILLFIAFLILVMYFGHWLYAKFHADSCTVGATHQFLQSQFHNDESCNCGESVAEAKSRGCQFESFAAAWLPAHCRDDELAREFDRSGPGPNGEWEYFADPKQTQRLTMTEVADLADSGGFFFVVHDWHIQHCHYVWRKLFRSRWTHVKLSLRSDTEKHIMHCMMMSEMRDQLDTVTTGSGVALHADVLPDGEGRFLSDKDRYGSGKSAHDGDSGKGDSY